MRQGVKVLRGTKAGCTALYGRQRTIPGQGLHGGLAADLGGGQRVGVRDGALQTPQYSR